MDINFFDMYFLTTDERQFLLYRLREGKPFEITLNDKGNRSFTNFHNPTYYSNIGGVLSAMKKRELLDSEAKTLEELSLELKRIDRMIEEVNERLS